MLRKLVFYMIPFMLFSCLFLAQPGLAFNSKHFLDHQRFLAGPAVPATDVLINGYYPGSQSEVALALLKNEITVITWQSSGNQDGSGTGIYARLCDYDKPLGSQEFLVNTYTDGDQVSPSVAALTTGGFVITWHSNVQDGSGYGVYAQRYKADGTRDGDEFRVNTETSKDQQWAVIAGLKSGGFVIAWQSLQNQDTSLYDIYARMYKADGTAAGDEFLVNTHLESSQMYPSVSSIYDGGFIIAWHSAQDTDGSNGIYTQMYKADGTKNGVETQVNSFTAGEQSYPSVAILLDGRFVITWESYQQEGTGKGRGVYAQIFKTDGTKSGSEFLVNTYINSDQKSASITPLADGGFIIVWQSTNQDGSGGGVYAQAYNVAGAASGIEFQVNTETLVDQFKPAAVGLKTGFAIVWHSMVLFKEPLDQYEIYAKWYLCPDTTPYFADNTCYDKCANSYPFYVGDACFESCPPSAPIIYNNDKCLSECPEEAPVLKDGTCHAAEPEVPEEPEEPENPEEPEEEEQETEEPKEATVINNENKATDVALKAFSVLSSSQPNYVLVSNSDSMILYIRYLKVNYPEKVLRMFEARGKDMISTGLGIGVPDKVGNSLNRMLLLDVFKYYDVNSSFLYHLWDPVISFLILLVATLIIMIFEYLTRSFPKLHAVFKVVLYIAKWNLPLIIICGNFNNIIFYSILEFKDTDLKSSMKNLSFAANIITLIIVALTVLMTILIARNVKKSKENPKIRKNWNDFAILYQPFKEDSYLTLGFFPIYFARILLFNIILTASFSSAVPQTIIIAVISLVFVLYLLWKRPLKSKLLMTQVIFNETILLVLNIAVVILAVFDHQNKEALDDRDALGELIIIMNILFSTSNLVFIGVIVLLILVTAYKKAKTAKSNGITSWSQIIAFVLTPQPDQPQYVSPSSVTKKEPIITHLDETSRSKLFAQSPTTDQSPVFPRGSLDGSALEDLSLTKGSPELRGKQATKRIHPLRLDSPPKTLLGGSGIVLHHMKDRTITHGRQKRTTSPEGRNGRNGVTRASDDSLTPVDSPTDKQSTLKQRIGNVYGPRSRTLRGPINL